MVYYTPATRPTTMNIPSYSYPFPFPFDLWALIGLGLLNLLYFGYTVAERVVIA
jgi:hypothetical protein